MCTYLELRLECDDQSINKIRGRLGQSKRSVERLNGIRWHTESSGHRKSNIQNNIVKRITLNCSEAWR